MKMQLSQSLIIDCIDELELSGFTSCQSRHIACIASYLCAFLFMQNLEKLEIIFCEEA